MSAALADQFISREDYRRWCAQQPGGRFERIDGRIVRLAAERVSHARVKHAIAVALDRAIAAAGVPCEALPDGVTVATGENDYEPDALVNCGPRMDGQAIAATNPVVVVEVLSPGTASVDTGGKLAGYFHIPSIAHYLIVHPSKRLVTHHRRTGKTIETTIVASGELRLDPPGITITLADIYDDPS